MRKFNDGYFLTEKEYNDMTENYNNLLKMLCKVLPKENNTTDIKLTRKDFYHLWNYGVEAMDLFNDVEDAPIYNHDVTIHWHGYYCDCEDGAIVSNTSLTQFRI